jgi:isoquinoline 1-oxidoreductase alpha subunit
MKINVNGVESEIPEDWLDETLLTVLREQLGLTGTRFSCGIGQCGACLVHIDGMPVPSCLVPVNSLGNASVATIEGVANSDGSLHPVQQAWIDERVPQCGYCQSGQIMRAVSLLKDNPNPDDAAIDAAMNPNLCRCGTYGRIKKAIKTAALAINAGTGK